MPPTMADRYRRWFDYEKDSHRKVLASLDSVAAEGRDSDAYRKALDLLGHIIAARRTWLHRLNPAFERPPAVFPSGVVREGLEANLEAMERGWEEYLGRIDEASLDRDVTFSTSEGGTYRSTLADVLLHIYGHSLYHRGQIATLVRVAGGQPAATDFIFWAREPVDPPTASSSLPSPG